jgi:hypothetical protein
MSQYPGSKSRLLIFIAGASSVCTKQELMVFFQRFGPIKNIQPKLCQGAANNRSNTATTSAKVYWLLQVADPGTYNTILNLDPCIFQGRKLYLAPFKSGIQLIIHNNGIAKRRILVKKVPTWFSESALIGLIEKQYGSVVTYFKFESDKPNYDTVEDFPKTRRVYTCSVTFKKKSDRDEIVKVGHLQLTPDVSVTVEKFVHLSAMRANVPVSKVKLGESRNHATESLDSTELGTHGHGIITERAQPNFKSKQNLVGTEPVFDTHGSRNRVSGILPIRNLDSTKPTKREYHRFQRSVTVAETSYVDVSEHHKQQVNLRFNLAGIPINRMPVGTSLTA